jgi:hypothetical protein
MVLEGVLSEGLLDSLTLRVWRNSQLLVKGLLLKKARVEKQVAVEEQAAHKKLSFSRLESQNRVYEDPADYLVDEEQLEEYLPHYKI